MSKRPIILAAVIVILTVVTAMALQRKDARAEHAREPTTADIIRGDVSEVIHVMGKLQPRSVPNVSSEISGRVTQVMVDFGSKVKKGQVLATIDSSTYEQQLHQARKDLERAENKHHFLKDKADRYKALHEEDALNRQDYDQSVLELKESELDVSTLASAVENARLALDRCTITSPVDGVVLFRQVEVGNTVAASLAAPMLFAIAEDLTKMHIVTSINELYVEKVHAGQPVTFEVDAIPDRQFQGRLAQIRPPYVPPDKQQQQQQTQQNPIVEHDVVIEVDNPDLRLRPSYTARVSIVIKERRNVLLIPNGALQIEELQSSEERPSEGETKAMVYRFPNGDRDADPEVVVVSLGIGSDEHTEVLSGLKEGDVVVTGFVATQEIHRPRGVF